LPRGSSPVPGRAAPREDSRGGARAGPAETGRSLDLEADPQEANDLGASAGHAAVRADLEAELRKILDPEAVNARAFADQERKIAKHGGPEAIKERGDFGYTPAPGQTPVFG
jgi:hypothetical protein